MRQIGRRHRLAAAATMIVGVWLGTAVPAAPATAAPIAVAQACDPAYGCPPSSVPPVINPVCTISPASAAAGDVVTATLSNVPVGREVKLLFDGQVVAQGVTSGSGATGSVGLSFTVQAGTTAGLHTVVFVGAGFQCDPTNGAGYRIVSVLGESQTRQPTSGSSVGTLARTGIAIALLLAIALVLVIAGSALVRATRRRRRRAERRRAAEPFVERLGR